MAHLLAFKIRVLGNNQDRFWRNRDNSITDAEKAHIKAHLLKALQEPNGLLAAQQAVLIGKIARKDVPHDWPALVCHYLVLLSLHFCFKRRTICE